MGSRFFRNPGEDSSSEESSSDDDNPEIEELSTKNSVSASENGELELATTESLPSNASVAVPEIDDEERNTSTLEQVRNDMFAALLEDYYRTRVAESMNATRDAPEVLTLARTVSAAAGQSLAQAGIMSAATTPSATGIRNQYLDYLDKAGLAALEGNLRAGDQTALLGDEDDRLALVSARQPGALQRMGPLDDATSNVIQEFGNLNVPSPQNDMVLGMSSPQHRSHYEVSFKQMKLLGKGGFGKVYHAYSPIDNKEYAIKKIPLSQRLTLRYQQGGLKELESVLREVQALAQLDHTNVVRYHSTWIEEPKRAPSVATQLRHMAARPHQRLLANQPHPTGRIIEPSDGIVFGADSSRRGSLEVADPGWSVVDTHDNSTSMRESQLFIDNKGTSSTDSTLDDTVCVLHVQMSLYPMTLSQYLAASPPMSSTSPSSSPRRHCFHLIPSLRIILGILSGLQYVHAQGLIHRDVKPGNIFLSTYEDVSSPSITSPTSQDGFYEVSSCPSCSKSSLAPPQNRPSFHLNPRIGDFGLVAELAEFTTTATNGPRSPASTDAAPLSPPSPSKPVGTEYYRPPPPQAFEPTRPKHEQTSQPEVNEKIDVYALGVILVELLWKCDTAAERIHVLRDTQRGRLPRGFADAINREGWEDVDGVGESVGECVRGMLKRDSGARMGCVEVRECLEGVLERCEGTTTGREGGAC